MNRRLVLATTLMGLSALGSAQVLYSWETGLEGWTDNSGDVVLNLAQSTTGATEGTQALSITWQGGFGWFNTGQTAGLVEQTLNGATQFELDVTVPDGFSGVSSWANMLLAFNDGTHGWRQLGASVNVPTTAGTHRLVFDYSGLAAPPASNPWFQIHLAVNSANGADRTLYLDNMHVVPEPASMIALALGGLGVIARRRRKV